MNCNNKNCHRFIRKDFNYFCVGCYHEIKRIIEINNNDFITYINKSFNTQYKFRDDLKFYQIYEFLLFKYPKIKSLACILESILYIKYLLCDIDLKNKIDFKIYNDYTHYNFRICGSIDCWTDHQFVQQIYNKSSSRPPIKLLL